MGTELGHLIRTARRANGLSQVDLAWRVGKSQRWVSTLETGATKMPRAKNLQLLAKALDLDLSDLYVAAELARTRAEARRMIDQTPRAENDLVDIVIDLVRKIDWDSDPSRFLILQPMLQTLVDQDNDRKKGDAAESPPARRQAVPS